MKKFLFYNIFFLTCFHVFAQNKFDITKYGAVGDGSTVATKALQSAIDACNKNGGGDVVIPTGVFIIGTVHLKSNEHLYLQSGAILRGAPTCKIMKHTHQKNHMPPFTKECFLPKTKRTL